MVLVVLVLAQVFIYIKDARQWQEVVVFYVGVGNRVAGGETTGDRYEVGDHEQIICLFFNEF